MDNAFYKDLARQSLAGHSLPIETCRNILTCDAVDVMLLLNAAYLVRKNFFGKQVTVHILNNVQNGYCSEDCHYCAQSKSSQAPIEEYPLKSDEEILLEAKNAYENGACRYCMVFAGREPSEKRIEHLAGLIRKIKSRYPIEVCVSAGLLDEDKARILVQAGLDRMNHNLNTSQKFYPNICTTHTYEDRLHTLKAAQKVGLQICSGVIVGMGEEADDVIEMAHALRDLEADSIPVNFFIPIEGTRADPDTKLSAEYCLRVLCLFRFLNPKTEIRMAAGRERYLRDLQVLGLYPANSLFLDGYLNAKGDGRGRTYRMIKDAGFSIVSEKSLDELIGREGHCSNEDSGGALKDLKDLRPHLIRDK